MIDKEKIFKIEIIIFVILLFLQNFAIIKTENFGIAALTIFLIWVTIEYKFFMKINIRFLKFLSIFTIFVLISAIFNKSLEVMQIFRMYMIFFIVWSIFKYMNIIEEKGKTEHFFKIFYYVLLVISIYGIYQLIATSLKLPIFLNIFSNNPSYGARGIYEVYDGWNKTARIYATFYEPSSYAIFTVIAYFLIMNNDKISKMKKIIITILSITNIVFTYSRSGWITFIYFICILLLFKIIKKNNIIKKIGKIGIVLLPFITLIIMSTIGLQMFGDLSSKGRTYSSLYYLEKTGDSVKSVLLGHGLGSVTLGDEKVVYNNTKIENFTHNGYIDIAYQLGWGFLLYVVWVIIRYLKMMKVENEWIVYASIFTISCFGTMYSVESIIALICIVVNWCEHKNMSEDENE